MRAIIDPPVTAFSEPDEIRAWLEELDRLREEYADDPETVNAIDVELAMARGWLARVGDDEGQA